MTGVVLSEHSMGAVSYSPEKQYATKVCFAVHAKSRDHSAGSSGWEKIDITATTKHLPMQDEMINVATECVKEGAN